ncbi:hypothetical protein B0H17DRAFT_1137158 [Mycena rosella]|uniref:Secreted protein n=1 Tax=Mycena rosella TaxID=1033263 RepID=A0AAD7GB73_MYCRO|nr:hypothetical protein B0H17DRAFT_1137158 [Mycena rosella]
MGFKILSVLITLSQASLRDSPARRPGDRLAPNLAVCGGTTPEQRPNDNLQAVAKIAALIGVQPLLQIAAPPVVPSRPSAPGTVPVAVPAGIFPRPRRNGSATHRRSPTNRRDGHGAQPYMFAGAQVSRPSFQISLTIGQCLQKFEDNPSLLWVVADADNGITHLVHLSLDGNGVVHGAVPAWWFLNVGLGELLVCPNLGNGGLILVH